MRVIGAILTAAFLSIAAVLASAFLFVGVTAAYAQENAGCMECNVTLWELRLLPHNATISFGDMETKEECEELKAQIEDQAAPEPFTALECVEVWAVRYGI